MPDLTDINTVPTKDDFVFRPLRKNSKGGFSGHVGLKNQADGTSKDILIQTPKERAPWGLSSLTGDDGQEKFSLDVAVSSPELLTWLAALDGAILEAAVTNSVEWFGKQLSPDVIKEFYRPILKQPRDARYSPTLSLKIPSRGGKLDVEFWNDDPQPQPMQPSEVSAGCSAVSIIKPRGL